LPADYAELDTKTLEPLEGYRGVLFGKSYRYLRNVFEKFRDKYKIKGFGDMTADEIMKITGLTLENAILAGKRNFTEPFLFLAESRPLELQKEVLDYGLRVTRGGRFYHLMSAQQGKGRAVKKTVHLFQGQNLEKITAVGLGDAENDYSMLEAVDLPVLLPKPDGNFEKMDLPGLIRAPSQGSKGWGTVVTAILNEFAQ
jgi:mannosyl-3-phosphoglycerate phosphatase